MTLDQALAYAVVGMMIVYTIGLILALRHDRSDA